MGSSETTLFKSFFMGGFECATHIRRDGLRVDVVASTGHDDHCAEDYSLLVQTGVLTVRDGLRWHLIERTPYRYDWSSFLPMLHAAHASGTQVIWDLCHWGVPDWLDIFSEEFVLHFAAFASEAAAVITAERQRLGLYEPQFYCAINEISFWSWIGGDRQNFYPFAENRGNELKQQLVRASVAALRAVRAVDLAARFVQPEPIIQITTDRLDTSRNMPFDAQAAATYTEAQFEAWDMLAGRRNAELNGSPDLLDILGVNYYWNNQWIHEGSHTPPGHLEHRALHSMLHELWLRYQRPILITETGAENDSALGWLGYVTAEVRQARRMGAVILGICLYPVMDYPGWDDDRHCPCGLIETDAGWSRRRLRADMLEELQLQQRILTFE